MNFNQCIDALLVSINTAPLTKGTFTQDNSSFSDNEEDADFSDLSEEYDPLDSGFIRE